MHVCVYVCPLIPAASHIGITKERYQRILRNTGIVLNFADFPKMLRSKVMAYYTYHEQLRRPSAFFPPRNKLLCWFEAYSYVFTAQTTALWKTACDSLAQTCETAQIYHRYYRYTGVLKISLAGANNSVPTTGLTPCIIIIHVYTCNYSGAGENIDAR